MKLSEPILTKRIPTAPFGDPKQRHTVGFDEYVKTGGYQALEKALSMEPTAVVNTSSKKHTTRRWSSWANFDKANAQAGRMQNPRRFCFTPTSRGG